MLNFQKYQKECKEGFKTRKGAEPKKDEMCDWTLGLGGESGEVQELLKHHLFHNEILDKMELAKELGDVLWYIAAIAETAGIKLEDVALLNQLKLRHRHGGKYSHDASGERHARESVFNETEAYKMIYNSINTHPGTLTTSLYKVDFDKLEAEDIMKEDEVNYYLGGAN